MSSSSSTMVRPRWSLAVYYEFVEPWPVWEPKRRVLLARLGVRLMAASCRGPLPTFAPALPRRRPVRGREEEVKDLREQGWQRDKIAKHLRMSARDVSRLLREAG